MKKFLAIVLALVMAFSMAACVEVGPSGQNAGAETDQKGDAEEAEEAAADPSDWPVLKMDIAPAADMHAQEDVQKAVNEYLVSINAGVQVEFVCIEFSQRGTVLTNMLTDSSNPIDLFTSRWYSNVSSLVKNDQCISLEPYRDTYPELFSLFPEQAYKAVQVKGEQYALPVADAFGGFMVYVMRKDIAEEIGAMDLADTKITEEQLDEILAKAEEAHPEMCWINDNNQPKLEKIDNLGDDNALGVLMNYGVDQKEIVNFYETDEWKAYIDRCKRWADSGYYIDDPVNSFVIPGDAVNNGIMGGYFNEVYSMDDCHALMRNLNPTIEMVVFQLSDSYCSNSNVGAAWLISSISKNPDAAMKLLNLLYTDPVLATFMGLGIEGQQYTKDENGCAWYAEGVDSTNSGWHCGAPWFYPNQTLMPPFNTDYADYYKDIVKFWDNTDKTFSDGMGFIFDSSNVSDQYMACTAIVGQYRKNLLYGQVDVEETNQKLIDELKENGIDEIIAEMNTQYAEFLANK